MNIKKCSKCGWEYPASWPGRTCKFCHGHILGGYCSKCGEWSDNLNKTNSRCRKCNSEEHAAWRHSRMNSADTKLQEWLKKIKALPTPYRTLTEDEWMQACKHFGGCAYCGSDQIDSRSMFIQFDKGGRYCAWNIIPACEKCETMHKFIQNPFKRMDEHLYRSQGNQTRKYNQSLDSLNKIVDYLQSKMEE